MDYKLNVVRIHVSDWARAFAFYAETLEMPVRFADAEMGWGGVLAQFADPDGNVLTLLGT